MGLLSRNKYFCISCGNKLKLLDDHDKFLCRNCFKQKDATDNSVCKICGKNSVEDKIINGRCKACRIKMQEERTAIADYNKLNKYREYLSKISPELHTHLNNNPSLYSDVMNRWNETLDRHNNSTNVNITELEEMYNKDYQLVDEKDAVRFIQELRKLKWYTHQSGFLYSPEAGVAVDNNDVFAIAYYRLGITNEYTCMYFTSDPYLPVFIVNEHSENIIDYLNKCCSKLKVPPFTTDNIEQHLDLLVENTQWLNKYHIMNLKTAVECRNPLFRIDNVTQVSEEKIKEKRIEAKKEMLNRGYYGIKKEIDDIDLMLSWFLFPKKSSRDKKEQFWININKAAGSFDEKNESISLWAKSNSQSRKKQALNENISKTKCKLIAAYEYGGREVLCGLLVYSITAFLLSLIPNLSLLPHVILTILAGSLIGGYIFLYTGYLWEELGELMISAGELMKGALLAIIALPIVGIIIAAVFLAIAIIIGGPIVMIGSVGGLCMFLSRVIIRSVGVILILSGCDIDEDDTELIEYILMGVFVVAVIVGIILMICG